jgi:hypothetical protein
MMIDMVGMVSVGVSEVVSVGVSEVVVAGIG